MSAETFKKRNLKGAFLIEALLAAMIVAVCLTGITQAMLGALRAGNFIEDYTQAQFLLENKMFELEQKGFWDGAMIREGDFPSPFKRYRFTVSAQPPSGIDTDKFLEVRIQVSWNSKMKRKNITAATFIFKKTDDEKQ